MLSVATNEHAHTELNLDLDELVREGARRMLTAALEAEVDAYIAVHAGQKDEHGHQLVRRNGRPGPAACHRGRPDRGRPPQGR
jgi:putative transposase